MGWFCYNQPDNLRSLKRNALQPDMLDNLRGAVLETDLDHGDTIWRDDMSVVILNDTPELWESTLCLRNGSDDLFVITCGMQYVVGHRPSF